MDGRWSVGEVWGRRGGVSDRRSRHEAQNLKLCHCSPFIYIKLQQLTYQFLVTQRQLNLVVCVLLYVGVHCPFSYIQHCCSYFCSCTAEIIMDNGEDETYYLQPPKIFCLVTFAWQATDTHSLQILTSLSY